MCWQQALFVAVVGGAVAGIVIEVFRMISNSIQRWLDLRRAKKLSAECERLAEDMCKREPGFNPKAHLLTVRLKRRAETGISVGDMNPYFDPDPKH